MESELRDAKMIETKSLDDLFMNEQVEIIALDIEGEELHALLGASKIIQRNKPKLAICVYHDLSHYVKIAETIKEYNSDYKLYFRHHSTVTIESVLYAI